MSRNAFIGVTIVGALALLGTGLYLIGGRDAAPRQARGFSTPGAPAVQLDLHEADFSLPEHNLPRGFDPGSPEFTLEVRQPPKAKPFVYVTQLPFTVPETAQRFAPKGMQVLVGDDALEFSTAGPSAPRPSWRISEDRLVITYPSPVDSVRIVHPTLMSRIDRLAPASAGLEPADFVRHRHLLDGITRAGLLLPAPTRASWTLELPEGATFTAQLALVEPPLDGYRSEGAAVVVSVDGIEVSRTSLAASKQWQPFTVDLSSHVGPALVEIHTDPAGSPDFDYVFLGSPAIASTASPPPRRILVVGMDTTRPDRLGLYGYDRPTSPELDERLHTGAIFDKAWCPAPRTRPSFRSSSTGRWPLQAVGATNIGEVFRTQGWATAGFAANVHLNPRFDFDVGFDLWQLDVQATADKQVDRALAFFRENVHRDSYAFLHIMDPHLFYRPPDDFAERFVRQVDPTLRSQVFNRWEVYRWQKTGELTDLRKQYVQDLYDAEIAYADQELGRLFSELDALPGETLLVVHNDHGEEFWDHGGYEHNHTLYDEVTKAILAVHPPGGMTARRLDVPASLVDIAPTVFDYAGFTELPELDGLSLRPFLEGAPGPSPLERDLPVAFLRYDRERWGVVVNGRYKYTLFTGSGRQELYDLETDPEERTNLASTVDTASYWKRLGSAHQIPVGYGWRIRVGLKPESGPVTLELPTQAAAAGVLDPEALSAHRANQAWGERPRKTSADVGEASLSEDGRILHFTPGREGSGALWVLFSDQVEPGGVLTRGEASLELSQKRKRYGWQADGEQLLIEPGIVIVPPPGEAARMRSGQDAVSDADIALLTALGYVGEEGADDEEDAAEDQADP